MTVAADAGLILLEDRRRRRRALLRVVLPLAGVAGIIAAILAIALYSFDANRRGALALTDELLATLHQRVEAEIGAFLDPMARATRIAAAYVEPTTLREARSPQLEAYLRGITSELPQGFQFLAADAEGNYLGFRRIGDDSFRTLRIFDGTPRRLVRTTTNMAGTATLLEDIAENNFQPRQRPWFTSAAAAQSLVWTDLYIFFETRQPGVTASYAIRAPDGAVRGVVGFDIALPALSEFLRGLRIGQRGRAVIVDRTGRVVAHPDSAAMLEETPTGVAARRLDALGDPVLARAYDRMRLAPSLHTVETIDGERHIILADPIGPGNGLGWQVVVTVPESDFTGFVNATNRNALLLSLGIVVLALGLAVVLVRQGLRADRAARRIARESASIAAQSQAFSELAASPAVFDPAQPVPPMLCERLALICRARRASIWRLSDNARRLTCEDAFEAAGGGHIAGAELLRDELPAFFALLDKGARVTAEDAARVPGLAELHRVWLHPLGSQAVAIEPITHKGRLLGACWVEDAAERGDQAREFQAAVARLLIPRMSQGLAAIATPAVRATPTQAAPARRSLPAAMTQGLQAEVFPQCAVLLARFSDPLALGRATPGGDGATLMQRIAAAAKDAASDAELPFLALLADQFIAASGIDARETPAQSAARIAAFALALRPAATRILEEAGEAPRFRIGIDLGIAIGTPVAAAPGAALFNLWGDAVRMAEHLAQTAPEGGIQASEAFHSACQDHFLFRPRGSFHMPRIGIQRSFLLAGAM